MVKILALGGMKLDKNNPKSFFRFEKFARLLVTSVNKKKIKILYFPTANDDIEEEYFLFKNFFESRFNCIVDCFKLYKKKDSYENSRKKIFSYDAIFVGGGNTLRMMKIWRKRKIDKIFIEAYKKNIFLSGTSAGAICWFMAGHSDSLKIKDRSKPFIRVKGLGIFPFLICPHFDTEKGRKNSFFSMVKKYGGKAFALDEYSGIFFDGKKLNSLSFKSKSYAHFIYFENGSIHMKKLTKSINF